MTTVSPNRSFHRARLGVETGVYQPQEDSRLLIETMNREALPSGRRVADLCTGSGVVAIAAAAAGAKSVLAVDICPRAVHSSRANAAAAGVAIRAVLGSWSCAKEFGPYDLVICNPPYVPESGSHPSDHPLPQAGPPLAYNGGPTGRLVLDPLCVAASTLLARGGTLLIVQSEFAEPDRTMHLLAKSGLHTSVAASRSIDFGPVLRHRASWLEHSGRLKPGLRKEQLVVIRADKS